MILHPPAISDTVINAVGNGRQGGDAYYSDTGAYHAACWSNSTASFVDLDPGGYSWTSVYGVDGNVQVGTGGGPDGPRAIMWTGTAASAVELHPAGSTYSYALGAGDGQQVGVFRDPNTLEGHAALWAGSAASLVDLHPTGAYYSLANGVGGGSQVGNAVYVGGYQTHAFVWSGTAESAVDLHPAGFVNSEAWDTDGTTQVGYGVSGTYEQRALMWTGTSASCVDLTPAGSMYAKAFGVAGSTQVGMFFAPNAEYHAIAWSGSPSSYIDLHQFLPPGFWQSQATGIAPDGTIGGFAYDNTGHSVAVIWRKAASLTFLGFSQPINDGSNAESVFKRGSTIPVRFQLLDDAGTPVLNEEAYISVTRLGVVEVPVNEADYIMPSDDGSAFRVTNTGYVYNLGTKNLVAGSRYRITATYSSGSHSVTVSIR